MQKLTKRRASREDMGASAAFPAPSLLVHPPAPPPSSQAVTSRARTPLREVLRAITVLRDFPPHDGGTVREGLQLREGKLARHVFHAAIGRGDELVCGQNRNPRRPDPRGGLTYSLQTVHAA